MPATMTAPGKAPGSGMSPMSPTDEEATSVLALERKSVHQFRDADEYLTAMKEDLAEWLNTLYGLKLTVDNFFDELETGLVLCEHSNNVQNFILERMRESNGKLLKPKPGHRPPNIDPEKTVPYRSNAKPGSFQARDNLSNFIEWTHRLGLPDCVLFETGDLVERKNDRSVVLCMLEVARQGARYGMQAPMLVQLEEEIDAEIESGEPPPPRPQRITCDLMSLDEMVRSMLRQCTCPDSFPMHRVSDGKYRIGESRTCIFVRILRKHVMVRIGGGWDTLENYLDRHDPCRCQAKGHKTPRRAGIKPKKPTAQTNGPAQNGDPQNGPAQNGAAQNGPSQNGPSQSGSPQKRPPLAAQPAETSQKTTPKPKHSNNTPAVHSKPKEKNQRSKSLATGLGCSPASSISNLSNRSPSPTSAADLRASREGQGRSPRAKKNLSASLDMAAQVATPRGYNTPRGRTTSMTDNQAYRNHNSNSRSSSIERHSRGLSVVDKAMPQGKPTDGNANMASTPNDRGRSRDRQTSGIPQRGCSTERSGIPTPRGQSRDRHATNGETAGIPTPRGQSRERLAANSDTDRGRARQRDNVSTPTRRNTRSRSVGATEITNRLSKTAPAAINKNNGNNPTTLMVTRNSEGHHLVNNTENKDKENKSLSILPNKLRMPGRSNSTSDAPSPANTIEDAPSLRKKRLSSSSLSLTDCAYDDLPEPAPDASLNQQMEKLFEEYRQVELGLFTNQINALTNAANNMDDVDLNAKCDKKKSVNSRPPLKKQSSVSSDMDDDRTMRSNIGSRDSLADSKGPVKTPARGRSPAPHGRVSCPEGGIRSSGYGMTRNTPSRGTSPAPSRGTSPAPKARVPMPSGQNGQAAQEAPVRGRSATPSRAATPRGQSPAPRGQNPAPGSRETTTQRGRSPVPNRPSTSSTPQGGRSSAPSRAGANPTLMSPATDHQQSALAVTPKTTSNTLYTSNTPTRSAPVRQASDQSDDSVFKTPAPAPARASRSVSSRRVSESSSTPVRQSSSKSRRVSESDTNKPLLMVTRNSEGHHMVNNTEHKVNVPLSSVNESHSSVDIPNKHPNELSQARSQSASRRASEATMNKTPVRQSKTPARRASESPNPIRAVTSSGKAAGFSSGKTAKRPGVNSRYLQASPALTQESAPTAETEESEALGRVVDILCDVPNEERQARVAAYVNSVREVMSVPQTKSNNNKATNKVKPTPRSQTPARPSSAMAKPTRRESAPAVGPRASSSMGIRAPSPGPGQMSRTQSRSKEDLLDAPAVQPNAKSNHVNIPKARTPQTQRSSSATPRARSVTPSNQSSAKNAQIPAVIRQKSEDIMNDSPAHKVERPRSQSVCADSREPDLSVPSPQRHNQATSPIDSNHTDPPVNNIQTKAAPRMAKTSGRTGIPGPASTHAQWRKASDPQPLRRYDSGVEINNMSPTETNTRGTEQWAHHRDLIVTDHLSDSDDEYY